MNSASDLTALPLLAPFPRVAPDRRTVSTGGRVFSDHRPRAGNRRDVRERRATPRVELELECEEQLGSSRYFRITNDLSTFGLSARHGQPHQIGTRLRLLLYVPDGEREALELEGEVVGTFDSQGGIRLAFRNAPVRILRRIHRYLLMRLSSR
jgi:hypothetical protein